MPYSHILVPTDGSDRSGRAVREAAQLAGALGSRVTLLTVQRTPRMPVPGMGERLDPAVLTALATVAREEADQVLAAATAIAAEAGVQAGQERIGEQPPHRAILSAAARLGCDLIVMASHGRRGFQGMLLGSQTQRVLLEASMPVLVVR